MTWLPIESKMFTSVSHDADKQILYLWDPLESTCRHASLSIL